MQVQSVEVRLPALWLRAALMAIAFSATNITLAYCAERPLWEAGAGVTVLDFPDYRGSDERHTLVLPIPYLVYRGEFFKSDHESVRGVLQTCVYGIRSGIAAVHGQHDAG